MTGAGEERNGLRGGSGDSGRGRDRNALRPAASVSRSAGHGAAERESGSGDNGLMQESMRPEGERIIKPGMPELIRQAGAEGCVLLKNDGTLPLDRRDEVAVFGRCQLDWFCVGYGSGGDVHPPYTVNLTEGLREAGFRCSRELAEVYRAWTEAPGNRAEPGSWGHWPYSHPEMPLESGLAEHIAETARTAVLVIGRAAGEDRESTPEPGSYYLTAAERDMLDAVTGAFDRVVLLLNIGSPMDFSWLEGYGERISAVLITWMGGMESGRQVADLLSGDVCPSGKLSDTIARHYEDYPSSASFGGEEYNDYAEGIFTGYRYFDRHPERVLFPFGFGLSYTRFDCRTESFRREQGRTELRVRVTNSGAHSGKEVVQLWCAAPEGRLEKPRRVLAGFAKTGNLPPGGSETVTLVSEDRNFASYDGEAHAFLLEEGEYRFTVNGQPAGSFFLGADAVLERCEALCQTVPQLRGRILSRLPREIAPVKNEGVSLGDAADGRISLDEFIAALSDRELEALSRGEGMMDSALGAPGNAGVFGGVIPSLREKGVPPLTCCDGPAGLRLRKYCSLIPCGTALACSWNTELVEALAGKTGEEMAESGVDVLLAPGLNIHRNPLCGRNFEYFSEDPLLTGKMAAAVVRGVQSAGRAACPKHFACNNQEYRRNTCDSRVSERALREIYLRGFEICVKEARPLTLMTSYNKINGVWAHYHYDLVTTVLRGEWGFHGTVITDWWMQKAESPEFPGLRDNGYRVRAQVDVLMPGDPVYGAKAYRSDGTLLETLGKPGGITRGELQRTAKNVLRLVLRLKYGRADNSSQTGGS
ncbi:MAG: glycoside hydrolase family 3 C-terminal domain-containing protein [Oscillospiraceae bacterium]|nr:glycoside hydrolase family 3 C-terminal domain-containing protein [Oscillospiraceae bacterium]